MSNPKVVDSLYVYDQLSEEDSFRLVELQPGDFNQPIHCRAKLGRLNDGQKYEALSYAWGDVNTKKAIRIDGSIVYISNNLHCALRTMRKEAEPIAVWADQLCIDQSNAKERDRQVRIMGEIYKHAERVAVFAEDHAAGDGSAAAEVVCEMTRRINQQLAQYQHIHAIPPVGPEQIIDYESLDWGSFKQLATSSWTTRTWIRQEVGFARSVRVLYRGIEFEWEQLMMIDRWFRMTGLALRSYLGLPDLGCRLWASFDPQNREKYNPFDGNFLTILRMTEAYDATDPRDKIYGLLGHPTARRKDGTLLVEPKYSWRLRDVYVDFARRWLDNEKDITIINLAVHTKASPTLQTITDFPSWCPQWHMRCGLYASLGVKTATVDYQASGTSKVAYQWLDSDRLELQGFTFGTISEVFDMFPNGHVSYHKRLASNCASGTFSSILQSVMRRIKSLRLAHSVAIEALAMTISASHSMRNECPTSGDDTAEGRKLQAEAFCNFLVQQAELDSGLDLDEFPQVRAGVTLDKERLVRHYQRCAERYTTAKRLCVVDGKYLCLGPLFAAQRDRVCIIFGAMTPFILRRAAQNEYLLIGDCYVHDIMYGEAVRTFRNSGGKEESFVIL